MLPEVTHFPSRPHDQRRVIQHERHWVWLMGLAVIAGIGITTFALWILLFDPPVMQNEPPATPWMFLFVGTCIFTLPGIFGFLQTKYGRYIIEPGQLSYVSCFFHKQVILRDVTRLHWEHAQPHPRMTVETEREKIKIELYGLPINAQRHLVLFLRRSIPQSAQEGWDEFGWKHARRILAKRKLSPAKRAEKIAAGAQFMTRRDIDKLVLKLTFVCAGIALFAAWILDDLRYLVFAGAPVFILMLRSTIPRHEVECSPIVTSQAFWWVLIVSGVTICLIFAFILDVGANPDRWPLIVQNKRFFNWLISALLGLMVIVPLPIFAWYVLKERKTRLAQIEELKNNQQSDWRQLERKYHIRNEDLVG